MYLTLLFLAVAYFSVIGILYWLMHSSGEDYFDFMKVLLLAFGASAPSLGAPSVEFTATGNPGFLQIEGHIPAESIRTDCKTATVDLSNLKTGIALRDKHATEKYLQTNLEENRFAKLNLETGMLTLHGVTKKVDLKTRAVYPPTGKWEFEIKLSDFQIEIPSFMGVTVADKVEIVAQCP